MTYTLTTAQLADLRFDLDLPDVGVFTDAELNRQFDRAGGDYDSAKVYVIRALLMSAAKMVDYRAAQSSESLSQITTNLRAALRDAESIAGMGGAVLSVGNFGLNIDSSNDNSSEWDGSEDVTA